MMRPKTVSAPRQFEMDTGELGARRADRNCLPVAARGQRQARRKGLAACCGLDAAAAGAARDRAGGAVAGLAPLSRDRAAAIGDITGQIDVVAIAGAADIESQLFVVVGVFCCLV